MFSQFLQSLFLSKEDLKWTKNIFLKLRVGDALLLKTITNQVVTFFRDLNVCKISQNLQCHVSIVSLYKLIAN